MLQKLSDKLQPDFTSDLPKLKIEPIQVGPNQYACPYCNKISKTSWHVKRHALVHQGEDKPYSCLYCNYKTNRKDNCVMHMQKMHNSY